MNLFRNVICRNRGEIARRWEYRSAANAAGKRSAAVCSGCWLIPDLRQFVWRSTDNDGPLIALPAGFLDGVRHAKQGRRGDGGIRRPGK